MQHSSTAGTSSTPAARKTRTVRRLDELLALGPSELAALYRDAETPRLHELDGDLRGRMLASPLARGALAGVVRALGAWGRFPWRGKTFSSRGEGSGEGANRLLSDRWRTLRFATSIGPSHGGDFDAVLLRYDLPGNPPLVRRIEDELRRIGPGLFLGQAWLPVAGKPRLCFYFGLEAPSAVVSTP